MSEVHPCTSIARRGSEHPLRPCPSATRQPGRVRRVSRFARNRSRRVAARSSSAYRPAPGRELIGPQTNAATLLEELISLAHEEEHVAAVEHDELRSRRCRRASPRRARSARCGPCGRAGSGWGRGSPEPRGAVVASRRRPLALVRVPGLGMAALEHRQRAQEVGGAHRRRQWSASPACARSPRRARGPSPDRGVRARARARCCRPSRCRPCAPADPQRVHQADGVVRHHLDRVRDVGLVAAARPAVVEGDHPVALASRAMMSPNVLRSLPGRRSGAPAGPRHAPRSRCQAR